MRDYEIDVQCPFCAAKTRLNRLMAHAKKSHPEVSASDFKKALGQKIKSDPSTVDLSRVSPQMAALGFLANTWSMTTR